MKKLVPPLLALLLVCFAPVTALASTTQYTLDELHLTLQIPADVLVITRESNLNDPVYDEYSYLDLADTQDSMRLYSSYLNAYFFDDYYTLTVYKEKSAETTEIFDLNQYSSAELQDIATDLCSSLDSLPNENPFSIEIYKHEAVPFIVMEFEKNLADHDVYYLVYLTIFNGQILRLSFLTFDDPFTTALRSDLLEIVGSIKFTATLRNPNPRIQPIALIFVAFAGFVIFVGAIVLVAKRKNHNAMAYPALSPAGYPSPGQYAGGYAGTQPTVYQPSTSPSPHPYGASSAFPAPSAQDAAVPQTPSPRYPTAQLLHTNPPPPRTAAAPSNQHNSPFASQLYHQPPPPPSSSALKKPPSSVPILPSATTYTHSSLPDTSTLTAALFHTKAENTHRENAPHVQADTVE